MDKKGFTLIELLAVIVIIGIISSIVVISVIKTLENSTNDSIEILREEVTNAAKRYITENEEPEEDSYPIYAKTLIDEGYLKELKDPDDAEVSCYNTSTSDSSTASNDSYVTVSIVTTSNENYKYTYTTTLQCFPEGESSYDLPRAE